MISNNVWSSKISHHLTYKFFNDDPKIDFIFYTIRYD